MRELRLERAPRAADDFESPPALLIAAGAGTGTTKTLVHRVAHLILGGADPHRLLLRASTARIGPGEPGVAHVDDTKKHGVTVFGRDLQLNHEQRPEAVVQHVIGLIARHVGSCRCSLAAATSGTASRVPSPPRSGCEAIVALRPTAPLILATWQRTGPCANRPAVPPAARHACYSPITWCGRRAGFCGQSPVAATAGW